jgi:MFS family permease
MTSTSLPDAPEVKPGEEKIDFPKVTTIAVMHMAQYFPEAFAAIALPAIFRREGLPLEMFWLLALPLVPRWLKWLLAMVVDNHGNTRIGFRKSWIIPCTSMGAALYIVIGFIEPVPASIYAISGILMVKGFIMAAQDISIDGFAAEQFLDHERSTGAAMTVFLAVTAGALGNAMLALVDSFGWTTAMVMASALLIAAVTPGIIRKEPPPPVAVQKRRAKGERASLWDTLRRKENHIVLPFLFFFGFQGTFHGAMWAVFMVDMGASNTDLALIGSVSALSGSAFTALLTPFLINTIGVRKTGLIGILPLPLIGAFYVYLAVIGTLPPLPVLISILALSSFTGGIWAYAVNTSRFRWPSKRQAATDYSTQSSVWNFGIWVAGSAAGFLAGGVGWVLFFMITYGVSTCVAIAYVLIIDPVEKICAARDEREAEGFAA